MILILGKNSQLSKEFCKIYKNKKKILSSKKIDFLNTEKILSILNMHKPKILLNFSAFNKLDEAEKSKKNYLINAISLKYISIFCKKNKVFLIHISTDNVFDGKRGFYSETSTPKPINNYGKAKLTGEKYIKKYCKKYIIIRTSWLYSFYKNNFLYKIKKKLQNKRSSFIYGSTDHVASPTSAISLAKAINLIVNLYLIGKKIKFGIYHFSNKGFVCKYTFIKKIYFYLKKKNIIKKKIIFVKVKQNHFNLLAIRPKKTVLICTKFERNFKYKINNWSEELKTVIDLAYSK